MNTYSTGTAKRPIRVFLSHSSKDSAHARQISSLLLRDSGYSVSSNAELSAGEDWLPKLESALKNADILVAVLTPKSVGDSWVLQETGAAWVLGKPMLAAASQIEIMDRFPVQLRSHPALSLKDIRSADGASRFLGEFKQALAEVFGPATDLALQR